MLQRLQVLADTPVPPSLTGTDLSSLLHARMDAASDVAWLRPVLFPEDDDG